MNAIINFFVRNRLFGDILTLFIFVAGVTSAIIIQKEVFPNVTFDIITVATYYPGASPEEVEKLITSSLEQDLQEVDGLKKVRSISVEGLSNIVITLDPDQTTEEEAKNDISDVVDAFDLPEGSEDPIVNSIESKQSPIIEVALSSDLPELELRQIAREVERELESVSGVARVVHKSLRDLEIKIEPDPKKLQQLDITLDDVINVLKLQNRSIPAGVIESGPNSNEPERIVRTIGEFKNTEDVLNTVVRANDFGRSIQIRDIATVRYGLEKSSVITRTNSKNSMTLTVLKKENSDAIKLVNAVYDKMDEIGPKYEGKFTSSYINDMSLFIKRRLRILNTNLVIGVILISIILSVFLPWRVAAIAVTGVLLSFFGTMFVFNISGASINLISLMGLIIVSGMLVDDAVVVSDNISKHMEEGKDPEQAAIDGAKEIWPAVTASILTTVCAFLPMFFMSGIFGKFIKEIPFGVITALVFSLAESVWILPQHMAHYVNRKHFEFKQGAKGLQRGRYLFQYYWDKKLVPRYLNVVGTIINRRYIVALSMFAFVIFSFFVSSKMRVVLFPPEGIETFFVRAKVPTGSSLESTMEMMKPIENLIAELPSNELKDYVNTIGLIQQEPNDPQTKRGTEYAQIAVYLTAETERDRTAKDIIDDLKEKLGKPEGFERLTFERVIPGPPVGKPVSVGVRGENFDELRAASTQLKEHIAQMPGVMDINDSFSPGKEEIHLTVRRNEAAAAGVSITQIGTTVRAAFDGIVATTIQELNDEVNLRVQLPKSERDSQKVLDRILVPNARGNLIPLNRVTYRSQSQGLASIEHEANKREIRISGEINTQVTDSTTVANKVREYLPQFLKDHPKVEVDFGGEEEDTQESLVSLFRAFGVAIMGIFLILILTFGNLFQPFLVLLTIPMGAVSVIWTFFVAGKPLSFFAMLGIVALSGVIVNNAIVLIDFVNRHRRSGKSSKDAILLAVKARIRPIFLTSVTTVCGLLPTAHGLGGLDKFVVPIAMSLGYGILFGSILTAFLFPAAIAIVDDLVSWLKKSKSRKTTQGV